MTDDLEPFADSLNEVFTRLGLPDPVLMARITSKWEDLAGRPWVGRSKPLFVRGKTLVVEASSPSMVAFLRYGESSLVEALENHLGRDVIDSVEILSPERNRKE